MTQIATLRRDRLEGDIPAEDRSETSGALVKLASTQNQLGKVNTSTNPDHIRITTSVPLKRCDPSCNCQCHARTRYQSPRWLSAVVGSLFYASTNPPTLDKRPCNSTKCFRPQQTNSVRFTYYFPTWMMRSAIVYSLWANLDGENASWFVRMPREIPEASDCWFHIHHGNEDAIKQLLQHRRISPFDIDSNGDSLLVVGLEFWSRLTGPQIK
jgi:hypothetical protein